MQSQSKMAVQKTRPETGPKTIRLPFNNPVSDVCNIRKSGIWIVANRILDKLAFKKFNFLFPNLSSFQIVA